MPPRGQAAVIGFRRHGTRVRGRLLPGGWLGLPSGDGFIQLESPQHGALLSRTKPRMPPAAVPTGGLASAIASGGEEARTEALEAAAALREREEEVALEEETREEGGSESEAERKKAEAAYIEAGCRDAVQLMQHPSAASIHRCHCAGGLLVALDLACTLLGARATKPTPPRKKLQKVSLRARRCHRRPSAPSPTSLANSPPPV